MKTEPSTPIHKLKSILVEHLHWHGARINILANVIFTILETRSVNLAQLATSFGDPTQVSANYQRLQRFFRSLEFNQNDIAKLIVHLIPVGNGPWKLTIDRSIWKFGETNFNALILGIAYRGISIPLFWTILDRTGHSNTAERIALMERFIECFGVDKIAMLLADREFVGADWFRWLQGQKIPFYQRIKSNTLVPDRWNQVTRLDVMFCLLKPGESCLLEGQRRVWDCLVHVSALRLEDDDLLIIASSDAPQNKAIDTYTGQWQTETLFGRLKTCGFSFADTHLKDTTSLSTMMGLLALVFAWDYRMGKSLHNGKHLTSNKKP